MSSTLNNPQAKPLKFARRVKKLSITSFGRCCHQQVQEALEDHLSWSPVWMLIAVDVWMFGASKGRLVSWHMVKLVRVSGSWFG